MLIFHGVGLEISETPVRRVITRGSVRHDGRFASRKMRRSIPWRSPSEFAFLVLAELDADVTGVYAQPFEVKWRDASGPHLHIPDFAVLRGTSVEIYDVGSDEDAGADKTRRTAAWTGRHCRSRGAFYGLGLGSALKAEPMMSNALTILRRLHDHVEGDLGLGIVERALCQQVTELGELADWSRRWGGTIETVVALVAHNRLSVDLRRPIDRSSTLWSVEAFPRHPRVLPFATAIMAPA